MVITLDAYFVHRARAKEGKDGNALNEVRLLCNSILNNDNVMSVDKSLKYLPTKAVLRYAAGDEIKLTEPEFTALADGFFDEIEEKYSTNRPKLALSS